MRIERSASLAAGVVMFVCLLVTGGCAGSEPAGASAVEGQMAPTWSAVDLSGEERSLEAHRGEVVLLDFWATWCGPCRRSSPHMQATHEEYGDDGLVVLAIQVNDKNGDATEYMAQSGYTYTVIPDGTWIGEAYGVRGIPQFFVIGRDGRVQTHHIGFGEDAGTVIEEAVQHALRADEG